MGYQLDQQLLLIPAAWKQQCPGCSPEARAPSLGPVWLVSAAFRRQSVQPPLWGQVL